MGIRRKRTGPGFPRDVWTGQAMRALAMTVHASIAIRTFERAQGVDDRPLRPYSTTPIYIGGETARRLAPKGGRRTDGGSTFYALGYLQYKLQSSGRAKPTLTLSGQLRRSWRVKRVGRHAAIIGTSGQPEVYNQGVQRLRQWVGVSPRDRRVMVREVQRLVRAALDRSRR